MIISYAILTHNEGDYIDKLLSFLIENKRDIDEIVVVDDHSTDEKTTSVLQKYSDEIRLYCRTFDGDASQKNYLNSKCIGDYILQLDADELMTADFIKMLPTILESNPNVDVYHVPRINTVEGLTPEHIKKWGWSVNDKGWVNFPDWQMRLYRNCDEVKWDGLLHSKIVGFNNYAHLPTDEIYCMLHPKEIDRQVDQNDLYDRIESTGRTKYKV
jgi:glycosyltransferase involved in cell wall biosynthesis